MEKLDKNILNKLGDLVREVMPRERISIDVAKGRAVSDSEIIDSIRVGVKYLLLDNEALQRENKMLKEMWDNSRDETKE